MTEMHVKRFCVRVEDACRVVIRDEADAVVASVHGDGAWDTARLFSCAADMARLLERLSKVLHYSRMEKDAEEIDEMLQRARWRR